MGVEQEIGKLKEKLKIPGRDIVFTNHARMQILSRPTTEADVVKFLKEGSDCLRYAELQETAEDGEVYRANYELNKRHDLVIVFKILKAKLLIITAYRTSRKWQKLVLRKNP